MSQIKKLHVPTVSRSTRGEIGSEKKLGIYYNRIIYTTLPRARRSHNGVRNSSNSNELHANIYMSNK